MHLFDCMITLSLSLLPPPPPPPHTHTRLWAMLATFGELVEFCVAFNGNWGSVTLIYGARRKKTTRSSLQGSPGVRGSKPVAKSLLAVPSGKWSPASPARTPFTTPSRPSSTGQSIILPGVPVEPTATSAVPVEQLA